MSTVSRKSLSNEPRWEEAPFYWLCPRIKAKSWPALTNEAAPPRAERLEDLKHHVVPMLLALGPHAHTDVVLLY